MRAAAVAALLLGLAAPASPQGALGELAGALAREAVRQAGGRPLELSPAIDRTGRGAGLALDFDEVLRTRVAGIARLASEGPRLQVQPVLADAPGRLIVSARLVAQPEGRLEDLVSLSVE
ncbi:MAG TPA: hypothetical protein VFO85_04320, partial [Vicinamibacteria bacterium]|nr:hypothetical protein [Vicinamibacteria bacterium]